MKKITLFIFIILLICKDKTNQKPNIVFIMSDDHTSQAWGIYGGILSEYVKNDGIKISSKELISPEYNIC